MGKKGDFTSAVIGQLLLRTDGLSTHTHALVLDSLGPGASKVVVDEIKTRGQSSFSAHRTTCHSVPNESWHWR